MSLLRSFICFAILGVCSAHAAQVTAELSDNETTTGQGVLLSLQITGGKAQQPPVFPEVKDLIINERGQSTSIRMENGRMDRSVTYSYVVGSTEAGEYEIPSATIRVDGKELKTQALKLVVVPTANGAPAGTGDRQQEEETGDVPGENGFLKFSLGTSGREHVYPGEIAPVRIRAYFPENSSVSLRGNPRPVGSAFTLHNLSQEPRQSRETVDGKRYLAVTWFGGLSATKTGTYPASFELEAQVATSSRVRGSFFPQISNKDITLTSADPPEIEVRELPREGRPEDFTGAIGKFAFGSLRIPQELEAGEPARVEAVLTGEGNFSLLREPHPLPAEDWKTYDGDSSFTAGDVASFAGEKRFQFNAVPLKPGDQPLSFGFSFFDPDKGEYQIVESDPQQVAITGEASVLTRQKDDRGAVASEPTETQLAPLKTELGKVRSYKPLVERTWFRSVTFASLGLFVLFQGLAFWRTRGIDHAKVAAKANSLAIRAALSEASQAAEGGDGIAFFMSARDAIRLKVAGQIGVRSKAVTLADLRVIEDKSVSEILNEADRIDYSGKATATKDPSDWKVTLDRALESLGTEGEKTV